MENNTSQPQNNQNKKNSEGVLTLLQPTDMSRTVEAALHVYQGRHEKLPELMQDVGTIILRATKRFSTTQLIVATGLLTVGAVLLTKYGSNMDMEFEEAA